MNVDNQALSSLNQVFSQILSPENAVRRAAEQYLRDLERAQGFPLLLITLMSTLTLSTAPHDIAIRQCAAVFLKNLVKRRWGPETEAADCISQTDKDFIKKNIIELMCSVPADVQKQLAEAVTIISKYDFPDKWEGLLPNLVVKLASGDIYVTKGVMLTANSIMKRFRYVFKSDSLYSELLFCLEGFQVPLLEKYKQNEHLISSTQNVQELTVLFETQRLINRIFFSLNWQDLPEFFEDNINNWMGEFAKYLAYKNPALENDDEESEPGPIEKLKTAVLDNLNLYATKYEEEFDPFLKQFTQLVWQLLMEVGSQP
eukprot:gene2761-3763_t